MNTDHKIGCVATHNFIVIRLKLKTNIGRANYWSVIPNTESRIY